MKYSLRNLMVGAILLPPLMAGAWFGYQWLSGVPELTDAEIDPDEVVHFVDSRAFRKTYICEVLNGRIAATPKWRDGDENPPVSAGHALRIAEKEVAVIGADESFRRELRSTSLVKVGKDWLWEVRFYWMPKQGGGSGIADNYAVVVLMDGSVVKPTAPDYPPSLPKSHAPAPNP